MFPDLLPPIDLDEPNHAIAFGHMLNVNLHGVFRQLDAIEQHDRELARKFYAAIAEECRKRAER